MSKKSKSTQESTPYGPAQPLIRDAIGQIEGMGVEGFTPAVYTGQRVAPMSTQTMSGINNMGALSSPQTSQAANAAVLSNLNMDDTYRNFDLINESVADSVKSNLATTFAGGGINSGLAQDTYTRALTEALAGVEYGAYNDAKNRQMTAIPMAADLTSMSLGAGQLLDQQSQREIDADMAQFYEEGNADIAAIEKYAQLAGMMGGMGGTTTGTSRTPINIADVGRFASGIGGFFG